MSTPLVDNFSFFCFIIKKLRIYTNQNFGLRLRRVFFASSKYPSSIPTFSSLLAFHSFFNSCSMLGVINPCANNRSVNLPRPKDADFPSRKKSEVIYGYN